MEPLKIRTEAELEQMKASEKKPPYINCYDCKKPMIETFRKERILMMNCPDRCPGQPELTLKNMGPYWNNITLEQGSY